MIGTIVLDISRTLGSLFVVGVMAGIGYLLFYVYSYYKLLPATTDPPPRVTELEHSIRVEYYKGGLSHLIVIPKEQESSLHCLFFGIRDGHPDQQVRFPQHTINRASVRVLGFDRVEMSNRLGRFLNSFSLDELPNPYPIS